METRKINRENLRPPPTMAKFKSCFLRESGVVGNAAVSKPMIFRISNCYSRPSHFSALVNSSWLIDAPLAHCRGDLLASL